MSERLQRMFEMNPGFTDAYAKGESWALKHADSLRGLDGESFRRHPERAHQEDGITPRNWCGTCPNKKGCVTCDLDGDYEAMKGKIAKWDD